MIVDRYFEVTDAVDDRLDEIEEVVFSDKPPPAVPREIFTVRTDLTTLRRAAAPMREVVNAIIRREIDFVDDQAIVHFHDIYDRVLRVGDLVEAQRDLLTGLLEANLAVTSNQLNQVMKKMTSWGAILIVATLIAGIYGMNFRHMPELRLAVRLPDGARADGRDDVRALPDVQASRLAVASRSSSAWSSSTTSPKLASAADHAAEPPTDLEQDDGDAGHDGRLDEHVGRRAAAPRRSRGTRGPRGSAPPRRHRRHQQRLPPVERPRLEHEHPERDRDQHQRRRWCAPRASGGRGRSARCRRHHERGRGRDDARPGCGTAAPAR